MESEQKENECDICYDTENTRVITCCKGKKWCAICEIKIRDLESSLIPRCPFCRKKLLRLDILPSYHNNVKYREPLIPVNSQIRQISPVSSNFSQDN